MHCINYFGVSGQTSPATVAVPDDEPRPAQSSLHLPTFRLYPLKIQESADLVWKSIKSQQGVGAWGPHDRIRNI